MNRNQLKIIWQKTDGRCHFCGKRLVFGAYGPSGSKIGKWHVDHIHPKARGGKNDVINYLPICKQCNRLRWFLDPKRIRKTFKYGVLAFREVRKKSETGKILHKLYLSNRVYNKKKRKKS